MPDDNEPSGAEKMFGDVAPVLGRFTKQGFEKEETS